MYTACRPLDGFPTDRQVSVHCKVKLPSIQCLLSNLIDTPFNPSYTQTAGKAKTSMKTPSNPSQFWQKLAANQPLVTVLALVLALILWQVLVWVTQLPAFILPAPAQVATKFVEVLQNGMLWRHLSATLFEIVLGLVIGTLLAVAVGYALSKSPLAEKLLTPFLVGSQAVPIVAIAPLLVIWFGPGIFSKTLICVLVVFFPVLVNTLVGLREVPQSLRELMNSLKASPMQTLRYLEYPAALPVLLGGLRVGATLSVIGAIVGELVGSDRGLGFMISLGRGQYDTALVFVAVLTLIVLASVLYGLIIWLESRLLAWQTWRQKP